MKLKKGYRVELVKVDVSLGFPKSKRLTKEENVDLMMQFMPLSEIYEEEDSFIFEYGAIADMETLLEGDIERVKKYLRKLK